MAATKKPAAKTAKKPAAKTAKKPAAQTRKNPEKAVKSEAAPIVSGGGDTHGGGHN